MEQKVPTSAWYAEQGYILRDDFDSDLFQSGSYTTEGIDINFLNIPVYRSETKEEYYRDAIVGAFRVGWAFYTGGVGPMGWAALQYVGEVTESD
jgi:hypothetical protein